MIMTENNADILNIQKLMKNLQWFVTQFIYSWTLFSFNNLLTCLSLEANILLLRTIKLSLYR